MIVRSLKDVERTAHFADFGNSTSHRLLTETDGMGFTICHTVVKAGTESHMEYKNQLEACYCIAGSGAFVAADGACYPITVGTVYALDQNDKHYLRASDTEDLILISVFNPSLTEPKVHELSLVGPSGNEARRN